MNKRGQFYLMAAIVIIIILSGLSYVYTSVRVNNEKLDLDSIVKEIHYESRQLVDNRVFAGKTDSEIAQDIRGIMDFYSDKYLNVELITAYGNESQVYLINESVNSISPVNGEVNVIIAGEVRAIEMKSGQHNIYVLAGKEEQGEKIIAVN